MSQTIIKKTFARRLVSSGVVLRYCHVMFYPNFTTYKCCRCVSALIDGRYALTIIDYCILIASRFVTLTLPARGLSLYVSKTFIIAVDP